MGLAVTMWHQSRSLRKEALAVLHQCLVGPVVDPAWAAAVEWVVEWEWAAVAEWVAVAEWAVAVAEAWVVVVVVAE